MAKKYAKRKRCSSPKEILHLRLGELLLESIGCEIPNDIPSKWEKHGDLVLLPAYSFRSELWSSFGNKLWMIVADTLKCNRVARKNSICNDNYRSPRVEFLLGSDSWVVHTDNKIKYAYDVKHCMFSAGNISEKLRIAQLSCEGETIVDMYAGIGYFTLPFLVHAKAPKVHACEWNPHAVEALSKNLILNGVKNKCVIHYGDNREVCPEKVADRVNLGLIPSSENGWKTACRALKPSRGILHIHGNVTSSIKTESCSRADNDHCESSLKREWIVWSENVRSTIDSILYELYGEKWNVSVQNVVRIKSYAPHIDHLVVDLICIFNKNFVKI
ncbi:tRNA wybutosine-synthesizing protein 2 homolog [Parasteatoda tepidariorum]|uniref:tRNA wybutosine-synthesizing protein 2 homolog n=1 Tax=Parasteatoda tepidariorum TaxID=114398 RepID=UPI00077F845D|nr:tRNA wybutosine-synthesizing protein 2 homolog [Parasteatoda tepidariorum]XP_015926256.1 tRNA wybutosine-synthesizing protein 2 homolog [Parasteatoda tepidariorum]XP_015926257.1 tRNA wybutosine-synthesizing protein 2 homolog [Parasteatoda tepidariorum]XP_015926259.1 tRNA wybutosine-synthesizing protein 2 homolog [Parasteatoda tepidariorum]